MKSLYNSNKHIVCTNIFALLRYSNMDYGCGSALRFILVLLIFISYDIACQWFVNFHRRIEDWPEQIKPKEDVVLIPLIPKLHEHGHKKTKNHEQFTCNLCKGIGLTDGECPERIWGSHNAIANSTKTMGPGSRHDVLDDHFGFWNYEKYVAMGWLLIYIPIWFFFPQTYSFRENTHAKILQSSS